MIKSFTVINFLGDSITIDITKPEETGFLVKSIEGLGPAKADVNTTGMATGDGSLFNSSRLNERNIVLDIMFVSNEEESIEDIRQKSYRYFPVKKMLEFQIRTDNRYVRTLGYVESNEPNIFSEFEGTQISIVCPDPYFYSAGENGLNVTEFFSVDPVFEFPFSNESVTEPLIVYGYIDTITEGNVLYLGDSDIGVTIHIHALGPATGITIYNTHTREKMRIDDKKFEALVGSGIQNGDSIIIETVIGHKGILLLRNGTYYNILNCLDKNVDWLTITKGDNFFAFTADTGITNLQFKIENRIIYEGV